MSDIVDIIFPLTSQLLTTILSESFPPLTNANIEDTSLFPEIFTLSNSRFFIFADVVVAKKLDSVIQFYLSINYLFYD